MASGDSQIDKPQCGCPKRAELPDVNINTGTDSINTESFKKSVKKTCSGEVVQQDQEESIHQCKVCHVYCGVWCSSYFMLFVI